MKFKINENLLFVKNKGYVLISDAPRKVGDWYVGTGFAGENIFKWDISQAKEYPDMTGIIIATDTTLFYDNIPQFEIENNNNFVENLIQTPTYLLDKYFGEDISNNADIFIKGYNHAKRNQRLYTEDDLRIAFAQGASTGIVNLMGKDLSFENYFNNTLDFLNARIIDEIEFEHEQIVVQNVAEVCHDTDQFQLKISISDKYPYGLLIVKNIKYKEK